MEPRRSDTAKALDFYRKEVTALGWSVGACTETGEDGQTKVALEGLDKETMRLDLLAGDGMTFVLISARRRANHRRCDLPFLWRKNHDQLTSNRG